MKETLLKIARYIVLACIMATLVWQYASENSIASQKAYFFCLALILSIEVKNFMNKILNGKKWVAEFFIVFSWIALIVYIRLFGIH